MEERTERPQRQSQPSLERMDQWLRGSLANSVLPASKLGQAYNYLRNHWEAFDYLVTGQIVPFRPAASVRGPKHVVKKGKTPVLDAEEALRLLDSIESTRFVVFGISH